MKIITFIKGTALTPEIVVKSNGTISMTGKSIMDDPTSFYQPLLNQIWMFKTQNMVFDLKLDEINAESTKQVLEMFELAKSNPWVDSLKVFWEYDPSCDNEYNYGMEFNHVLGPSNEYIKPGNMDLL